jgi:mandelate racemase
MPDALRIGGVRGWLDLAGRAAAEGIAIAPHYYREFDAPLAASTIGSIYVENFFWTDQVFDWDGAYKDGCVLAPDSPGFGFRLRGDARDRWKVKQARVSST